MKIKSGSFQMMVGAGLLASFAMALTAQAANAGTSKITCGYADSRNKLLEITHTATSVTGRDLLTTSDIDGSAIRSTFKVLKVDAGAELGVYVYEIHMTERYNVGELTENHRDDHSVPGSSDIHIALKLNILHPENSEVHVRSRETIKDFKWEPGFLATHFDEDTTRKIVCEIDRE